MSFLGVFFAILTVNRLEKALFWSSLCQISGKVVKKADLQPFLSFLGVLWALFTEFYQDKTLKKRTSRAPLVKFREKTKKKAGLQQFSGVLFFNFAFMTFIRWSKKFSTKLYFPTLKNTKNISGCWGKCL